MRKFLQQVDAHIQQLDQYLKKFDEELRRGMFVSASSSLHQEQCPNLLVSLTVEQLSLYGFSFMQKEMLLLLLELLLPLLKIMESPEGLVKVREGARSK